MGYNGACRREELTNMSVDDIEYKSDVIVVTVPKTKTNVKRMFVIAENLWINLIKKYASLRPKIVTHRRFFITYRKGYCTVTPIGINTIGKMPKIIAHFLKLPNPELFTGHCFRRSSISHLANKGSDLITIKRHGGWKSSAVAEGYIETSMQKKLEVAQILSSQPNTSGCSNIPDPYTYNHDRQSVSNNPTTEQSFIAAESLPGITINAQDTSTVIVKVYNNSTIYGESKQNL